MSPLAWLVLAVVLLLVPIISQIGRHEEYRYCQFCLDFTRSVYDAVKGMQDRGEKLSQPFHKPVEAGWRRFCSKCRLKYQDEEVR